MKTEMKFRGKLDPFYENEYLASRTDDYAEDTLRFTKTKAILKKQGWSDRDGDDTIELVRKNGSFKLKICTWQHVQREGHHRCDVGHSHPVLKVDPLWLEHFEITRDEAHRLARWILGNED